MVFEEFYVLYLESEIFNFQVLLKLQIKGLHFHQLENELSSQLVVTSMPQTIQ